MPAGFVLSLGLVSHVFSVLIQVQCIQQRHHMWDPIQQNFVKQNHVIFCVAKSNVEFETLSCLYKPYQLSRFSQVGFGAHYPKF